MKKVTCILLIVMTTLMFSGCFGIFDSDSESVLKSGYYEADADEFYETCSLCNGSGKNDCTWCNATGYQDVAGTTILCGTCGGSGQMDCLVCVGEGQLYVYNNPDNVVIDPYSSGGYSSGYSGGASGNCFKCNGEGIVQCISCNGTGGLPDTRYAPDYNGSGMGMYQTTQKCLGCNGTGIHDCPYC